MADRSHNTTRVPDRAIRMELISHFNLYPDTVCTSVEMAQELKRDSDRVERQMEDLVDLGILRRSIDSGDILYSYLPPLSAAIIGRKEKHEWAKPQSTEHAGEEETGRAGESGSMGEKGGGAQEGEAAVRLQLMIAALKEECWKVCLETLLEIAYRCEEAPCAAYLLGDKCSEVLWQCKRGDFHTKTDMMESGDVRNMVIEGELIRKKGLLDTAHHIKYLYPLGRDEDVLICMSRNGSYHIDLHFLRSLFVDILPVAAQKRRRDLTRELTVEKMLQDSIYRNAADGPDMFSSLAGAMASVAKSVDARRVSLLMEDGNGSLRTFYTYGLRNNPREQGHSFPAGRGIAGWCVERSADANLSDPMGDTRFISNGHDDIESMLCCPLIPPGGEAIGAICAVNKQGFESGCTTRFDDRDLRLFRGIARSLANAFAARDNRTKVLSGKTIRSALAAQSF